MWRRVGVQGGADVVALVRPGADLPILAATLVGRVVVVWGRRGVVGGGAGPAAMAWWVKVWGRDDQHHAAITPH